MAIKKSALYRSLWQSCDALRGGMDASQYKDYVLILLFVKYVSDRYAGNPHAEIEVPTGGSFADMVAVKNHPEIGDKLNKIIGALADANDLRGIITVADFNDDAKLGSGREKIDRLTKLVGIFESSGLDFRKNRADGDDLLGDAYEYLMRHFATESGKSKGQFYTPAEVSRIMAKVIGINKATSREQSIYDPTCGSGSLLLKAADEAPNGITIYGQEMDNATVALAKMNMILHDNAAAEIHQGNTLANPHTWDATQGLKRFDFAVANPPFSTKAWSQGVDPANDPYARFTDGVPPPKNGDYAFLQHLLTSLKPRAGKGAIILPHGVLFRGNAEAVIRQSIVSKGYIKGIIGLPANLFYGTGIPACIIVIDKENAHVRKGIFMIDASKDFIKDGNKNRLRDQDSHRIVDTFTKQLEVPKYARMVSLAEIEANDYNLNIPRYIDSSAPEDIQDIEAHLRGGIPNRDLDALEPYWNFFPALRETLFSYGGRQGYSALRVESATLKNTILTHPEFVAFTDLARDTFGEWRERYIERLRGLEVGSLPKALIAEISEALLETFKALSLIDEYDVYQHLMSYWTETMQDDAFIISQEGWKASTDLIPESLIIQRYFAQEQEAITALEAERDELTRQLEEQNEEQNSENSYLSEATDDKDKVTKASLKKRVRDLGVVPDSDEERTFIVEYLALMEAITDASKKVRDAQKALDTKVQAKYPMLSVEEIKVLVVEDKWLTTLATAIQSEVDRVSQTLTGRVQTLAERYATPLPQLSEKVVGLSDTITKHLQKMGFVWN